MYLRKYDAKIYKTLYIELAFMEFSNFFFFQKILSGPITGENIL